MKLFCPFFDDGLRVRLLQIDLAPLVGADLEVMKADTLKMRLHRAFVFTNLKSGQGVTQVADFAITKGGLRKSAAYVTRGP